MASQKGKTDAMAVQLMDRFLDWMCDRIGLCIRFDGDLVTPDWSEGDGDPHHRPEHTPITKARSR